MRGLQFRITCWMAAGFFGLTFMILLAHTAHSVHWIFRYQKRTLQPIAEGIEAEIRNADMAATSPLSDRHAERLTEKLRFAAGNRAIGCAITNRNGETLFRTPRFNVPVHQRRFDRRKKRSIHFLSVKSEEKTIDEMLSDWHFLYRHDAGDVIIFLDNQQEYESVERFAEGFLVALLLALVLAIPSGYLYSRRILTPIRTVRSGLTQIRNDDLSARIPEEGLSEELRSLVNGMNETFAELEDAFTRSSEFSAAAAHELKTPLTAMRGNLEVCLGKTRSREEYQRVLADALEQTVILARIVDQLLLLASPERAAKSRDLRIFPLSEAVLTVLAICQSTAAQRNIDVRLTTVHDSHIEGNRDLLARMVHNLVHNAVKFSEPGTTVDIRVDREGNCGVIDVEDRGPGIEPQNRDRIFDRFFQVDPSRHSGRGLGLAIVKWIVTYHAGTIHVDSTPGQGATFRVRLPLRQKHDRETATGTYPQNSGTPS